MKVHFFIAALFALATAAFARPQSACADTIATEVAAHVENGDKTNQCNLGVTLFGLTFGISIGECPLFVIVYPQHRHCDGLYNEGTECVAGDTLEVRLKRCSCAFLGGFGFKLLVPTCDCTDVGNAGWIEDHKTINCVIQPSAAAN
ncbi:MAG: hypothetical protein JNL28_01660 [Planctomycetes bacterium]|nr:hypothetical protein [Planctomycetota bacterium]